jgi:hypothetical protein
MSAAATPNRASAPPGLYPEPGTGLQRDGTGSTWADQDKREAKPKFSLVGGLIAFVYGRSGSFGLVNVAKEFAVMIGGIW